MKINFKQNGIVDFFFPYTQRIRIEAKSTAHFNPQGIYRIDREFYTFRAFAWHYILILPYLLKRFLWEYKNALDFLFLADPYFYQRGTIAFDATSNSGAFTNASSVSWSHTTTGSNLALSAGVPYYEFVTSDNNVTATYNSVSMTNRADIKAGVTPSYRSVMFTLANAASGANTVALTFVGGAYGAAGVCSFSGTDIVDEFDVAGTNSSASATSISKAITTLNANSFIVDSLKTGNTNTGLATTGANQTSRWDVLGSNTNINAGSSMTTTTAGSYTPGWSWTTAAATAYAVASINEGVAVKKKVVSNLLTMKVG